MKRSRENAQETEPNGMSVLLLEGYKYPDEAISLAEKLKVNLYLDETEIDENNLILKFDDSGLTLSHGSLSMQGDFAKLIPRLKSTNIRSEMLVKAAKIKSEPDNGKLTLLDATAGMGEDSLILASAGFNIEMFEYDPIIASILKDTLRRSENIPELSEAVSRMTLHEGDSIEGMKKGDIKPDIILLDPMFPERQKTGLVKKKFQLLHHIEPPCSDDEAMLNAAIEASPIKIIIKRPAKGEYLAGRKPDYSLDGKAIRYDIIVVRK